MPRLTPLGNCDEKARTRRQAFLATMSWHRPGGLSRRIYANVGNPLSSLSNVIGYWRTRTPVAL